MNSGNKDQKEIELMKSDEIEHNLKMQSSIQTSNQENIPKPVPRKLSSTTNNETIKEIAETVLKNDKTVLENDESIAETNETVLEKDETIAEADEKALEIDETVVEKDEIVLLKDETVLVKDEAVFKKNETVLENSETVLENEETVKEVNEKKDIVHTFPIPAPRKISSTSNRIDPVDTGNETIYSEHTFLPVPAPRKSSNANQGPKTLPRKHIYRFLKSSYKMLWDTPYSFKYLPQDILLDLLGQICLLQGVSQQQ